MEPRIEELEKKWMVGKSLRMSLEENKTQELWRSFMTQRKSIVNPVGTDLYSIQIYDKGMPFSEFTPTKEFLKCAMTEVKEGEPAPEGMESRMLEGGLYAVFIHKGSPQEFAKTAGYIYGQWLPNSKYELDDRPHFEVLGEAYKGNHPDSEEEVWIPVREVGKYEIRNKK